MDVTMFHSRGQLTIETSRGNHENCYLSLSVKDDGEFTLYTNIGDLYELGIKIAKAAVEMGVEDTEGLCKSS